MRDGGVGQHAFTERCDTATTLPNYREHAQYAMMGPTSPRRTSASIMMRIVAAKPPPWGRLTSWR